MPTLQTAPAPPSRLDSARADSVRADSLAPIPATTSVATLPGHVSASGPARLLFEQDKLYTVVAVLLIVWLGLAMLLLRNDRRLDRLEKAQKRGEGG